MKLRRVVARNITMARIASGLSKIQFAKKMKTDPSNAARIEAGQNLTLDTIERIAKVLAVKPMDLFNFDQSDEVTDFHAIETALINARRLVEILEAIRKDK